MAQITNFGKVDTLAINGEINIPLVIFTRINSGKDEYVGFIPALTKKDIVCYNKEECKKTLKETAKKILTNMAKNNTPFPFFPTKEEILADYKTTKEIIYIKVKSNNRKG